MSGSLIVHLINLAYACDSDNMSILHIITLIQFTMYRNTMHVRAHVNTATFYCTNFSASVRYFLLQFTLSYSKKFAHSDAWTNKNHKRLNKKNEKMFYPIFDIAFWLFLAICADSSFRFCLLYYGMLRFCGCSQPPKRNYHDKNIECEFKCNW